MNTLQTKILNSSSDYGGCLTTFVNAYSYALLRKHPPLIRSFDHIHLDGILLQLIVKVIMNKTIPRLSFDFTSLAEPIFHTAQKQQQNVFLIGSKTQEIEQAARNIKQTFPGLDIIGFRNGYFDSDRTYRDVQKEITLLNPDIVIAGMGTPFQETFLVDLKKNGWKGTGFTCGGFFHQTAKNTEYYPEWADRFNLRWAYRILDEPYLFKRYTVDYLKGSLLFISDYLKNNDKRH